MLQCATIKAMLPKLVQHIYSRQVYRCLQHSEHMVIASMANIMEAKH